MPESHAARGTRRGRRLLSDLGAELRMARVAAGLTLARVGASAGVSAGELSRIERGLAPWLDILTAARVCAVVGLDLSVRAYAGGNPLRDSVSLRLQALFLHRVRPSIVVRTEVPVGDERGQRAWDTTLEQAGERAAVEYESRLTDVQALVRRTTLKCRDSGIDRVILVLNDTNANRDAVRASREYLRPLFPLEPAEVLEALAAGHLPPAGGIVFLRPARPSRVRAA